FQMISQKNYQVVNVDTVVCVEKPKIMGFAGEMRKVIADILQIAVDDISVKATTTEKLGFIGKEEGIMAQAVVLLRQQE
ncbi:MAG TPA: 2-C-methyl-D-erythritol 2,4-cyclodiphosphate synthase, partial [Puia sp.]|nr:2-C-methyl-D-erythritol 2,4-cyclodiphosphate synthase [Puia sp.]